MPDHKPDQPEPSGFRESANRSEDAGIAEETAAGQDTAPAVDGDLRRSEDESEAHPS
ncbi:hypothetical protein [uncultured Sphingomonas sp.]|jgi:hypothetical protein|uniref:hypothetical protein n=1 Tax=unclassified Sphingomonas TaxID=196159 RepID=UPI0025DB47E5|nr:hypothetical protein [uncultured Sphingomonas sp.]